MASKQKGKQAAQQAASQPVVSVDKANDRNMTVLRRIDPQLEEILTTAGHVCLYRMTVDDLQWQRKNIEGSLFLIKRRTQPRFQMLVLNKLSTDNYTEPIHGGLELETNPPYLMYTHGDEEIHGIWFFDESDLQRVAALLQKILAQLPKPDGSAAGAPPVPQLQVQHQAQPQQAQPQQQAPPPSMAPLSLAEQHSGAGSSGHTPAAAAAGGGASRGGDAFWDRAVHVTEETLQHKQQLVPNSNLLDGPQPGAGGGGGGSGALQGLLKAAQQKHTSAQRSLPTPLASPVPVPNSTSAPAEQAAAGGAAALLTPAFFEQQQQQQQQQQKQRQAQPAPAAAAAATAVNGAGGGNPLQQLLSRAAKSTQSGGQLAASGSTGALRAAPQPPIGALSPEVVRDKVKAALIRLANNDAFVDAMAQELRTVGLLQ